MESNSMIFTFHTLANKLLYQCRLATINDMHWIFHIEVPKFVFHLPALTFPGSVPPQHLLNFFFLECTSSS